MYSGHFSSNMHSSIIVYFENAFSLLVIITSTFSHSDLRSCIITKTLPIVAPINNITVIIDAKLLMYSNSITSKSQFIYYLYLIPHLTINLINKLVNPKTKAISLLFIFSLCLTLSLLYFK